MRSNMKVEVATAIRVGLARAGLNQKAIADHLDISTTQVGRRMSGEVDWRVSELEAVAELLGVSLRDLLPESTPTP